MKYLLSALLSVSFVFSIQAREPKQPIKHQQQEDFDTLAKNIFSEIWWIKGTQLRIQKLKEHIQALFTKYSHEDSKKIFSKLTQTFINNIGGMSKGLSSSIAGLTSYSKTTTSDNLIMAHYMQELMAHLNMPLDHTCETWISTYNSYGIPSGSASISCTDYLTKYPINEAEKHQENLTIFVHELMHFHSQREQGLTLGDSVFHEMNPSEDASQTDHSFSLDLALAAGQDGIKKLGMLYGMIVYNKQMALEARIESIQKAIDGGDDYLDPQIFKDHVTLNAQLSAIQAQIKRYATEILSFKSMDRDHIKITRDATAMVMAENNKISIVFGGMGVGQGGMEEGKALAYKYNNPPLAFQSGLGGAHQGFFERLSVSWDEIYTFCHEYATSIGHPINALDFEIIGHSMGGGVAPIAALRLAELTFHGNPGDHIKVITFGAPRTLDATLAESYNKILGNNTYMFVHDGDNHVPNQPPAAIGYIHVGKRLNIPQPQVNPNPAINIKVFHQYPGYKNVMDQCDKMLQTQHTMCARVGKEESALVYHLQTAKNVILAPLRVLGSIFGNESTLIEHTINVPHPRPNDPQNPAAHDSGKAVEG